MQSSHPKAAHAHRRSSTGNDVALQNLELSDQFARRAPPLNAARACQDRPNEPANLRQRLCRPPLLHFDAEHAALKYP
jgi:hypothetical protein